MYKLNGKVVSFVEYVNRLGQKVTSEQIESARQALEALPNKNVDKYLKVD